MPMPFLRAVKLSVSLLYVELVRPQYEGPLRLADGRIVMAHGLADTQMTALSDYELSVVDYSNKAVADVRVRLTADLRAETEPTMAQLRNFCAGPLVRMQHDHLRGLLTLAPTWMGLPPLVLAMPEPVLLDVMVR